MKPVASLLMKRKRPQPVDVVRPHLVPVATDAPVWMHPSEMARCCSEADENAANEALEAKLQRSS